MSSRILYDTRDNSILRCQPEPKGSASLPSFDALCKSARVLESEKENADTITIEGDYLTHQVQNKFRVVELDDEIKVKEKPKVVIEPSTTELNTSDTNILTINLNIQSTLSIDDISSVNMKINDVNFTIDITNNEGSKEIELNELDTYEIACTEDKLISKSVTVEVI